MKDNEQSRFIRWGIPGWMMFLAFASYIAIDILLSPEPQKNSLEILLEQFVLYTTSNAAISALVVLLVAAAGVPLGFFLYQIYFYIRWNSPFSRDGFLPPFIVGRWEELDKILDNINVRALAGNDPWRKKVIKDPMFAIDHGLKWRYIEYFFIETLQKVENNPSGSNLYSRYRYLMDILHILGAGLFGIYAGYLGYLFAKVKAGNISLTMMMLVNIVLLGGLMMLLEVEDKVKQNKKSVARAIQNKQIIIRPIKFLPFLQYTNPSVIYLFFILAILFLGSPSPYLTSQPLELQIPYRLMLLILTIFAWYASKIKNCSREVRLTEVTTLFLLVLMSLIAAHYINSLTSFLIEWWNVGWCIFVFLVTNMMFIKNRQNTRNDLSTLQNFTINRYLLQNATQEPEPAKKRTSRKTASKK